VGDRVVPRTHERSLAFSVCSVRRFHRTLRRERTNVGEDLVGMGADVGDLVDLGDRAIGRDQERHPLWVLRILLIGSAFDAVRLTNGPVDIAQQRETESVFFGEDEVLRRGVEARAEDLGARRLELWASVTEALPFTRSAAGGCLGKPPQHDPRTPQVAESHRVAPLVGKGEIRSECTDIDHGASIGA
jgi:hypothetical protein